MKRNWYYTIKNEKIILYPVLGGGKDNVAILDIYLNESVPRNKRSPKRHTILRKHNLEQLLTLGLEYAGYKITECKDLYFSVENFRDTFKIYGTLYI